MDRGSERQMSFSGDDIQNARKKEEKKDVHQKAPKNHSLTGRAQGC